MYRRIFFTLAIAVTLPGPALSQSADLPWLQNTRAPAAAQSSLPWHNDAPSHLAPPEMEDAGDTRQLDDRKLNSMARDYYAISLKDTKATAKYAALSKRVADFQKVLKSRSYDARDISADAASLQKRISIMKKKAAAAALAK